MKQTRSDFSYVIRLLLAIFVGVGFGLLLNFIFVTSNASFVPSVMQVVGSIKHICGQLIFYAVPLVIIGFVAPAICKLGKNASSMLTAAILLAYFSSVGAALFSMSAGYLILPHITSPASISEVIESSKLLFKLDIPPIMPVMTALITAFLIGLTAVWTKAKLVEELLFNFEGMMSVTIKKLVLPLLPFFIATTFTELAYAGTLSKPLFAFATVVGVALLGHFIWLFILYSIAGIISKRNPWLIIKHYGPAYLTAVGTMSSAATLPVALNCIHKTPLLRRDIADFAIPLGATIHLCGSVLTETLFVMFISLVLYGSLPSLGVMLLFIFLLGIFAVGAPGVPGGTVMASLGIISSVLGFDAAGIALLLAIFALQDSFGTACNVTGDGAIALMLDGIFNPEAKNLQEPEKS